MVELRDQYALVLLRELALGDIEIVAENAGRLSRRLIIEGTSHGQDPSDLPVRTDDAKLEIELIAATDGRVPLRLDPLDIIGMDSAAEIRVSLYSSGFEAKDSFELWSPSKLTRPQVPIPQADARLQLSQPKPLFAFSKRIVDLVTLNDVRRQSHIEVKYAQVFVVELARRPELGTQYAQRPLLGTHNWR